MSIEFLSAGDAVTLRPHRALLIEGAAERRRTAQTPPVGVT
jgi:hypothetical protein